MEALSGIPDLLPPHYDDPRRDDRGFPETEALSREVCSLPMNVEISDEEVDYVISVVRLFYEK